MEFREYQPNEKYYRPPVYNKRSQTMESAAMILSVLSVAMSSCIYISLICGALAMMFALLSKGGELTMSSRARIGFWLGAIGIGLTIVLYVSAVMSILDQFGSLENYLRSTSEMYGIDFEELFQEMNSSYSMQ